MKKTTIIILQILFTTTLIGQSSFIEKIINSDIKNISKISKYRHTIDTSSTFKPDSILDFSRPLERIEYYDAGGMMYKDEYHGKKVAPLINRFIYTEDGRLQSVKPKPIRVREKKQVVEKQYAYLENGIRKTTTIYADSSEFNYYVQYDDDGLLKSEFVLDDKLDTTMVIHYAYNEDNLRKSIYAKRKGKEVTNSISKYDQKKRKASVVYYDVNGEKEAEDKYDYSSDYNYTVTSTDFVEDKIKTTTVIRFVDQYSNIIKEYRNSKYAPSKWTITQYEIEYRK